MGPDGALIKEITVKLDSESGTWLMGSLSHAKSPKRSRRLCKSSQCEELFSWYIPKAWLPVPWFSRVDFDWPSRLILKHIAIKMQSDFFCPEGKILLHVKKKTHIVTYYLGCRSIKNVRWLPKTQHPPLLIYDLLMVGVAAAATLVPAKTWKLERAGSFPISFPFSMLFQYQTSRYLILSWSTIWQKSSWTPDHHTHTCFLCILYQMFTLLLRLHLHMASMLLRHFQAA